MRTRSRFVEWSASTLASLAGVCLTLGGFAAPALAAGPTAGATRMGSAPTGQPIQLVLPLAANVAGLERLATAVTTVGSPQYGQFEPPATLERRFGAPAADRTRVLSYLHHAGATGAKIDATGLFADATMKVSLAQRLFGTSLARYESARAGRFLAPTGPSRVPRALAGAVTGVVGLDTRPVFNPSHFSADNVPSGVDQRSGTPAASACAGALQQRGFTPNQYLTAYDYSALQSQGITGQGERVALIEINGFHYSDVSSFARCFGLRLPAVNSYGVGIKHPLAPGGETTLDLEVLDAAAPGLKEIDVYESSPRASDVLRSLTAPVQNRNKTPAVISASLGTCEPALLEAIGVSGLRSAEGALAFAAAAGISVLASSGDVGSTACIGHDGMPIDALAVSYPASSPFVTGVGGTNLSLGVDNTISAQPVWNDGPFDLSAGGGGVSDVFRRPAYQHGFVAPNRRIVPDVSMLADVLPGYDIFCTAHGDCINKDNSSNPWVAVGGTSAAAPLLAGGIALVDQALRGQGREQLGAANSLLYTIGRSSAAGSVFYDVTANDNDLGPYIGSHQPLACCSAGPGFDYASGLGSVDLAKLVFAAAGLQPPIAAVGVSLPRQRPFALGHLLARLSCSRHCLVGSFADVSIGRATPFKVRSDTFVFNRRGGRTVKLRFSHGQLRSLHGGLRAHRRISATVYAVIVDSSGNVESTSAGRRLRISH